jgi:hypothetical protein
VVVACGGQVTTPDHDASAQFDADLQSDATPQDGASEPPVVCDTSTGGTGYGVCPPGWHCDLRKVVYTVWNLCCPPGQTGTSDQCINPQN